MRLDVTTLADAGFGEPEWTVEALVAMLDLLPFGVSVWDRDARCVFWNSTVSRLYATSASVVLGQPVAALVANAELPQSQSWTEAVLGGQRVTLDRTITGPDGQLLHTLIRLTPLVVDGQVEGFCSMTTDVTTQVRLLAEARRDQGQSDVLLERRRLATELDKRVVSRLKTAQALLAATHHDHPSDTTSGSLLNRVLEIVDDASTEVRSAAVGTLHDQPFPSTAHPNHLGALDHPALDHPSPVHATAEHTTSHRPRPTSVPGMPAKIVTSPSAVWANLVDADGDPNAQSAVGSATPLHSWNLKRVVAVLDQLPLLITMWDPAGHNTFANQVAVTELRANTYRDVNGRKLADILSPQEYADSEPAITAALHGHPQTTEVAVTAPDGQARHYQIHYRALRWAAHPTASPTHPDVPAHRTAGDHRHSAAAPPPWNRPRPRPA